LFLDKKEEQRKGDSAHVEMWINSMLTSGWNTRSWMQIEVHFPILIMWFNCTNKMSDHICCVQWPFIQFLQWINSWKPWTVDIIAKTVRIFLQLINPWNYVLELQFMLLWYRNLNGNSLSGRVPAALGGRLLHGASFKYAATSVAL